MTEDQAVMVQACYNAMTYDGLVCKITHTMEGYDVIVSAHGKELVDVLRELAKTGWLQYPTKENAEETE